MIVTQLDSTYAPWLDLFLSSLQITNPDMPTSVELVNFHPRLVEHFVSKYPATIFELVTLADASRHILAHRKVDTAMSALRRHPGRAWYLVCDVDLLFRKPLEVLINDVVTHDAAVVFRDGYWEEQRFEHLRVNSSMVGFRDGRLLEAWKREMMKPTCLGYEASSWFYDQVALWSVTQHLELDYHAIDDQVYLNRELDNDAVIWSAHLEPKVLMYLEFLAERDRLRAA